MSRHSSREAHCPQALHGVVHRLSTGHSHKGMTFPMPLPSRFMRERGLEGRVLDA